MHSETGSKADSIEAEQIEKILSVLARANCPVPLGYISLHTGIEKPLEILELMEERGLVRRRCPTDWSCSLDPMFELTPTT